MDGNLLNVPNVSAVPQYSPLRYPGGKSRLYPFIKMWIQSRPKKPSKLVEPFAGAGHVGLATAIEGMVDHVVFADIDANISAVWTTILSDDYQWLMAKISQFQMTKSELQNSFTDKIKSNKERAFQVILRNRVSRGGITAPGAGIIEQGENGRGLYSRWYPATLTRRIHEISKVRHKIEYSKADGLSILRKFSKSRENVFFIDPPYPISGRRLYQHFDVDPESVFRLASTITGAFLITYEDITEIRRLVSKYSFEAMRVCLFTTHHHKKIELLISNDLSWLKGVLAGPLLK